MSVQTKLSEYRSLLQEKAELQKRDLDLAVQIQVCEKAMELELMLAKAGESAERPENEEFADKHGHLLDADLQDFLEETTRGTSATAKFLDRSEQTVRRRCDRGIYRVTNPGSKNRQISTVSVVETLINAEAEEET